jgi:hypothetical protein
MKNYFIPILALCVCCVPPTRAADAPPAAVDPVKLAAFMEKWKDLVPNKRPADEGPEAEAEQPLLLAAMAKDPLGPWWIYLSNDIAMATYRIGELPSEERQPAAAKVVELAKQAEKITAEAMVSRGTNLAPRLQIDRDMWRRIQASWILEAGSKYLPEARALGQAMLVNPPTTNSWDGNRGDLIYAGNQLLGRVALREGKLPEARDYLLKAGQAPVSSQLQGIGPDNALAIEMLRHGEPEDRKAVLAYLDAIAHFWANPIVLPNRGYMKNRAENHLKQLAEWKETIRAGNVPAGWQQKETVASAPQR